MPDNVGNSLNTATSIVLGSTTQRFSDSVELGDDDYYRFTLAASSSFNLSLSGLSANANVELLNSSGSVAQINGVPQTSANGGALVESINTILNPGTYYIHIFPGPATDPSDQSTTPSTNYNLDVIADNGERTDIVWRNYASGQDGIWRLNGTNLTSVTDITNIPDTRWRISGTGDFNGDGITDLVWRFYGNEPSANGINGVWLLNSDGTLANYLNLAPQPDLNWEIRGVADFNKDGTPDLLWRNVSTGQNGIWYLNSGGATIAVSSLPGLLGWDLQGVGDFNGDNSPDLVWRNTSDGENAFWYLNNGAFAGAQLFVSDPNLSKSFQGVGDFNGDGLDDLLMRNYADGSNEVWLMNGTDRTAVVPILGVTDTNWRPLAPYNRQEAVNLLDVAGNASSAPLDIGPLNGDAIYRDQVGLGADTDDYYRFTLGSKTRLNVRLDGPTNGPGDPLEANLDLQLYNSLGLAIQQSNNPGNSPEGLTDVDLDAGTYSIRVAPGSTGAVSRYELRLQVNNLPVLVSSGPLTVSEGSAQTISNTLLLVSDENNSPTELSYTLVNPPNVTNGSLQLNGNALTTGSVFTQSDINKGKIVYQNNGGESLTDTFVFAVNDGQGGAIPNTTFTVDVIPVNDPPQLLSLNRVTVSEGATTTISSTSLLVTDVEQSALQLVYTLSSLPNQGDLFVGTRQLTAGNSFTQADINSGRLAYRQNGSEPQAADDQFSFVVSDGAGGFLVPQTQSLSIHILNVNDPPQLVSNTALTVSQGATSVIGSTLLQATDAEFTSPAQQDLIKFSISQLPTRGTLFLNGVAQPSAFTFSQADINAGRISYVQNGTGTNSDRFTFSLSDGIASPGPFTYDIFVQGVSGPPVLTTKNTLTVSEGAVVTVSNSFLKVTDPDSNSAQIAYTLGSLPTSGTLTRLGTALTTGQTFTQADLDSNRIEYRNNGSEPSPTNPTDSFTFSFHDETGAGPTGSQPFSISLISVNDLPTLLTPTPQITVTEGAALPITSSILKATDPDNIASELTYSLASSPNAGTILLSGTAINSFTQADIDSGQLQYVQNGSEATSDSFTFNLTDRSGTPVGPVTFNVNIVPFNDPPGLASFAGITVSEGNASAISSSNLLITDNDGPSPLAYTIGSLPSQGFLLLGSVTLSTGNTFTQADVNNNQIVYQHNGSEPSPGNPTDLFTFSFHDGAGAGPAGSRTFSISLISVNDLPTLLTPTPQITVTEGAALPITSSILKATDPDNIASELTYSLASSPNAGTVLLSGTVANSFTQADIDGGQLQYAQNGSEATSDSFTFNLTDRSGTPVGPVTFNVNIVPFNDPPGLASFAGTTVTENNTAVISDSNLLITDNDGPGPLTYTIGSLPTQGVLRRGATTLSTGGTFTQADISNGQLVYVQNGSEPSPNGVSDGIDKFTFTASDGATAGLGAPGIIPTNTFSITVVNANDAPIITLPSSVSTNEDTPFTFASNNRITVSDPDGGPNFTATITSLSGNNLTLGSTSGLSGLSGNNSSSINFQANSTFLNGALNNLKYSGLQDFNGVDSIVIQVDDGLGGVDTKTITMNVIAINDAPTLTVPTGTLTINEDTPTTPLTLTVNDVDAGSNPLKVTIRSSNGGVTVNDNGALGFVNSTNGTGTVTFTAGLSDVQFALSNLVYQGNPDYFGTDRVTVTIDDQGATGQPGAQSITKTLSFNVLSVNDKPTFTGGTVNPVIEDAGALTIANFATSIFRGAANESGQTLRFTVTSADTTLFTNLFLTAPAVDSTSGNLTFRTKPDANGDIALTAVLIDNGGTTNGGVDASDPFVFTLSVLQKNDVPTFSITSVSRNQTVNEDVGSVTVNNWATNISPGPSTPAANESTQSSNFLITTSNPSLFSVAPQINISGSNGALVYRPADNANGVATVTVQLKDDGGTDNGGVDTSPPQIFTINVRSVNDVPTFNSTVTTLDILEDSGAQSVPFATDLYAGADNESSQTLSFTTTNSNPGLFLFAPTIDATGQLSYNVKADANGSAIVTATLKDNGGTANGGVNASAPYLFTINVAQVNDAPVFTKGANQTVNEDASAVTVSNWATGIRPGPNTTLANESTQTVSFLLNTDNTALFSAGPALDSTGKLTYTLAPNAYGQATVTVQLQDNGGTANGGIDTSAPQTFVIQANPVNDAPTLTVPTSTVIVTEDNSFDFSGSNALLLTDIDSGDLPIRVTLAVGKGTISVPSASGLTVTSGANGGSTVTFTGKVEDFVAAFSSVVYTPNANYSGNDTLTVTVNDQGNIGSGGAKQVAKTVAISVTAQNDPPVLVSLNSLLVSEGGNRGISNTLLRTTDVDNTTAQLQYTVGTAPGTGVLRLSTGAGFTTLVSGSIFTQADIDSARLSYLQNGSETTSDLFTFTVSDGAIALPESTFNISVIPVNDAPTPLVNQTLTLSEGDTSTISNTFLQYTDNDTAPTALIYTITSAPTTGALRLAGADLTAGSTFTEDQLDTGLITYEHNGNETTADSFNFSLSDGVSSVGGSFNISVISVNDPPTVVSSGPLSVNEGALVSVLNTVLNTTDPDTNASQVVYTISGAPIFGSLLNGSTTLANGSTFTQAQINSGAITYKHNGSEQATDVFVFQVSDGVNPSTSGIVNINVAPVDDAPVLVSNAGLLLNAATPTTRVISSSQLRATDVDNTVSQVLFKVTSLPNPQIGVLKLGGTNLTIGQTFSQQDINQGRLTYQYLGSGTSDGFQFTLADSGGAVGGSSFFAISFSS